MQEGVGSNRGTGVWRGHPIKEVLRERHAQAKEHRVQSGLFSSGMLVKCPCMNSPTRRPGTSRTLRVGEKGSCNHGSFVFDWGMVLMVMSSEDDRFWISVNFPPWPCLCMAMIDMPVPNSDSDSGLTLTLTLVPPVGLIRIIPAEPGHPPFLRIW
ncbi:unnamed protein product [Discosporangium mesarthrocarpum]